MRYVCGELVFGAAWDKDTADRGIFHMVAFAAGFYFICRFITSWSLCGNLMLYSRNIIVLIIMSCEPAPRICC